MGWVARGEGPLYSARRLRVCWVAGRLATATRASLCASPLSRRQRSCDPAPHRAPAPHRVPAPCADHRSKVNYDLVKVLEGGLEEGIQSMIMLDQQEMLKELLEEQNA